MQKEKIPRLFLSEIITMNLKMHNTIRLKTDMANEIIDTIQIFVCDM